jgi:hypothetical protein
VPFVLSLNLHRRHLTESQRAMIAAKVANLPAHRPDETAAIAAVKQADAAKLLNVSADSIQRAKKVQHQGVPDLVEEVEKGNISVSTAADITQLHPTEQQKIVADVKAGKHSKASLRKAVEEAVGFKAPRPSPAKAREEAKRLETVIRAARRADAAVAPPAGKKRQVNWPPR